MADLVRTIEEDAEGLSDGQEGDLEFGGKGLAFNDLSDDEPEIPQGQNWDFSGHGNLAEETDEVTTNLESKIKKQLRKRQRMENGAKVASDDSEEEEDEEEDENPKLEEEWERKKKSKLSSAPVQETEPRSDHLVTNIRFADLSLSRPLLRAVDDMGFDSPTPIQRDVIPPALAGRDILATAETGSGKTASFLLPLLERLLQSANVRGRKRDAAGQIVTGRVATKATILIPTRELGVQCHSMLKGLSKHSNITSQLVTGGYQQHEQSISLRHQPDIVVATPGRLLDHLINTQSVHMELLEIVIFDEADRLLELGFRTECLEVMKRCSKGRQTMLFSATLNASVQDLAALALIKPVKVAVNKVSVATNLEQEFVKVPSEALREAVLLSLCMRTFKKSVIVFCQTKVACHRLAIIFGLCSLRFAEVHGNLTQNQRLEALERFQAGEADFLFATDLAARGLDLPHVETVINFQLPSDPSRYIHRVGRTARMGRYGRAVTLHTPEEYHRVKKLGRQCAKDTQAKVLRRTVSSQSVEECSVKIAGFEKSIKAILVDEDLEKEMLSADKLINKQENMQAHKKEIAGRPAKTWVMTNGEKIQIQKEDSERKEAALAGLEVKGKKKRQKEMYNRPKLNAEQKKEANKRRKLRNRKLQENADDRKAMVIGKASKRRLSKAVGQEKSKGSAASANTPKPKKKKKKGK
eukprot:gnl/MRDRNA2_/MRDRNA2_29654_c0_seq2.p1 gnl/MRDRNA2_/MRDRNA2_29654_c0~~gnl/MRDRNA2_/MRDRNA2_29654_c0_seq2.p1  ORF type:complete len:716 (+),score=192.95 gnl/MRDRNA2_/MRDRNA2_29654_c0_seq2:60-2150(+)